MDECTVIVFSHPTFAGAPRSPGLVDVSDLPNMELPGEIVTRGDTSGECPGSSCL